MFKKLAIMECVDLRNKCSDIINSNVLVRVKPFNVVILKFWEASVFTEVLCLRYVEQQTLKKNYDIIVAASGMHWHRCGSDRSCSMTFGCNGPVFSIFHLATNLNFAV
jgi:hypothetical protein